MNRILLLLAAVGLLVLTGAAVLVLQPWVPAHEVREEVTTHPPCPSCTSELTMYSAVVLTDAQTVEDYETIARAEHPRGTDVSFYVFTKDGKSFIKGNAAYAATADGLRYYNSVNHDDQNKYPYVIAYTRMGE